mmetsp:Transcript_11740/g.16988  ORF Transcript_11740/g.16988 Transcript_11740/m.16988 type:complete len:94 (+) Transcript_11740:271-552(+)
MKITEEKYHDVNGKVGKLTNELTRTGEKCDDIKREVDSKGSSMTDMTSLLNIKAALQDIKAEIKTFDMRIGILVSFWELNVWVFSYSIALLHT